MSPAIAERRIETTAEGLRVDRPKSLASKLAEVMAAVHAVPKRGRNQHFGYDYATEADIVHAIRHELASRHVILVPQVDTFEMKELASKIDDKGKEKTRDPLTVLTMTFTFMDGESGERIERKWTGVGQDGGDKGVYKAMTGGEKYFLLKTFLIPTGDDPEATPKARREQRPVASAAAPDHVVDTSTGEEVPAANRPAPPAGYCYIDRYELRNGWHEIAFYNHLGDGHALVLSTKKSQIGTLAGEAFQRGIPVKFGYSDKKPAKKGEAYLDSIVMWKPEAKPATSEAGPWDLEGVDHSAPDPDDPLPF